MVVKITNEEVIDVTLAIAKKLCVRGNSCKSIAWLKTESKYIHNNTRAFDEAKN